MITEIDNDTIDFLAKHKLTFNQFCICLLIYQKDVSQIIKYTEEIGYLTGGTIMRTDGKIVDELKDLVTRKYLEYNFVDKTDVHSLDNYSVTSKFTVAFLDQFERFARELWEAYPKFLTFDGEEKPIAKAVDYEEYEEKYTKILKKDLSAHKAAMAVVAKLGRHAPMKIEKFVGSRHWENVEQENEQRRSRLF